ncbi:MAG: hypothetical protein KDM63_20410 [Verrucomicrobiae bacterium]|nr:hypothetical protein [Verrucomicrobiae bacterium]MCB1089413.1 hypothetical protein [Verrucomicrobiae bacterium]MCB1092505.1 hypothetical protein [Verrucomicrobiae bacterium]
MDDASPNHNPAESEDAEKASIPTEEPRELTAEEQMARFEDALKEEDWGHQPC